MKRETQNVEFKQSMPMECGNFNAEAQRRKGTQSYEKGVGNQRFDSLRIFAPLRLCVKNNGREAEERKCAESRGFALHEMVECP